MAQSIIRCQVSLDRKSGLAEDLVVNTFHFDGDVPDWTDPTHPWTSNENSLLPGLMNRLQTFYAGIAPHLSHRLSGTGVIKVYSMHEPEPRVPKHEEPITFTPSGTALPGEVALCLSFRGANASGVNMARRRGRVYLGPLGTNVIGAAGATDAGIRPSQTVIDDILAQAAAMATGTSGAYRLAIYSPRTHTASLDLDQATEDAVELWIDNAFDTQRRRGAAPTGRTTAAIT